MAHTNTIAAFAQTLAESAPRAPHQVATFPLAIKPSNFRFVVARRRTPNETPFKNGGIGVTVIVIRAQWEECRAQSEHRHSGNWMDAIATTVTCEVTCMLPLPPNHLLTLLFQYGALVGARQLRIVGIVVLPNPSTSSALVRITALKTLLQNANPANVTDAFVRTFTKFADKRAPGAFNVASSDAQFPPNQTLTLVKRISTEPGFHAFPIGAEPRHINDVSYYVDEIDDE